MKLPCLSLTPCFSWVTNANDILKPFQRFCPPRETAKAVGNPPLCGTTPLKQGANETCLPSPASVRRILRCSLLLATFCVLFQQTITLAEEAKANIRFEAVEVYVDSGAKPLAAFQLEFRVEAGDAKIVGVEGGSHAAFREPPFYDPKALQQERVILAAFNTAKADQLPKNKTRVATIHLRISGRTEPEFSVKLKTAASVDGKKIPAKTTLERKEK